jgi:hypothetical protein
VRSLLILLLTVTNCYAGSGYLQLPAEKNPAACHYRLTIDGRTIAQMRWIERFDLEKAHAQFTPPEGVPGWYVDLVRGWIDSAYLAADAPEEAVRWFNKEWDGCEGAES